MPPVYWDYLQVRFMYINYAKKLDFDNNIKWFIISDSKINEQVDIYGDIDGQCKRGLKVEYTGKTMYVGTGYLKMVRHELFDKGVQPK